MFTFSIGANLNWLVQGGQVYWAFPYGKVSVEKGSSENLMPNCSCEER